jgi:hypothetical protein
MYGGGYYGGYGGYGYGGYGYGGYGYGTTQYSSQMPLEISTAGCGDGTTITATVKGVDAKSKSWTYHSDPNHSACK